MDPSLSEVIYGDMKIPFTVVRTNRSTIGIAVEPSGKVVVHAPPDTAEVKIFNTVNKKRKWIAGKIQHVSLVKSPVPKMQEPVSGEKIRYKNKLYRLKIHLQKKRGSYIVFTGGILHIHVNENLTEDKRAEKIKQLIINWYKERATGILNQRIDRYSKLVKQKPGSISVRDTKIRWGSCTKTGKLLFNWKIIMAPISAIDYVVIHELCHLKIKGHTPEFWQLLESIMPDYRKWKEWLHVNGLLLDLRM